MVFMIAIINHAPGDLPIQEELTSFGISSVDYWCYAEVGTNPIDLMIVHCPEKDENPNLITRKRFFEIGQESWLSPSKLRSGGIVIFVSSVGLNETVPPARLPLRDRQGHCFVVGLNKVASTTESGRQLLTGQEWNAIVEWAKRSVGKQTIEDLVALADTTVKRLVWPTRSRKRELMALAVLCQGYLACYAKEGSSGEVSSNPEDQIVELLPGDQSKVTADHWEEVQEADWWLKVLLESDVAKGTYEEIREALSTSGILGNGSRIPSANVSRLSEALVSGKVTDVSIIAGVLTELAEDLK
jgi:hypothetical protein